MEPLIMNPVRKEAFLVLLLEDWVILQTMLHNFCDNILIINLYMPILH